MDLKKRYFLEGICPFLFFRYLPCFFGLGMKQMYLNSTWSHPKLALKAPKQCEKIMLIFGLFSTTLLGHEEWNELDCFFASRGGSRRRQFWLRFPWVYCDSHGCWNVFSWKGLKTLRMNHHGSASIYGSMNVDSRTPALSSCVKNSSKLNSYSDKPTKYSTKKESEDSNKLKLF